MNHVFYDKMDDFLTIYLDDILVFSPSIEEHEVYLHWVFNLLRKKLFKSQNKKVLFWSIRIGILKTHSNTI